MRIDRPFATHELEALFESVALHIDAQPPEVRTRFMCKAFFLLAQASGDVSLALGALQAAAETSHVQGRSAG
jgi:hypothetical protein